jgi:hypothetical protein
MTIETRCCRRAGCRPPIGSQCCVLPVQRSAAVVLGAVIIFDLASPASFSSHCIVCCGRGETLVRRWCLSVAEEGVVAIHSLSLSHYRRSIRRAFWLMVVDRNASPATLGHEPTWRHPIQNHHLGRCCHKEALSSNLGRSTFDHIYSICEHTSCPQPN